MTGFAEQVFRLHELPKGIATWMIDQSETQVREKSTLAKVN